MYMSTPSASTIASIAEFRDEDETWNMRVASQDQLEDEMKRI